MTRTRAHERVISTRIEKTSRGLLNNTLHKQNNRFLSATKFHKTVYYQGKSNGSTIHGSNILLYFEYYTFFFGIPFLYLFIKRRVNYECS